MYHKMTNITVITLKLVNQSICETAHVTKQATNLYFPTIPMAIGYQQMSLRPRFGLPIIKNVGHSILKGTNMNKLVGLINRGLAAFTISLSAFLVVCVVWQVISRYVLGKPSTVTDELARYLFMWVALIGAAYTTGLKRHLAIDLLTMKLTGKRKMINEIFIQLAIAVFAYIVLVHGGIQLAAKTLATGQVTPALSLQMGYIYFCLPISGVLMIFYSAVFAYERVKTLTCSKALITKSELD